MNAEALLKEERPSLADFAAHDACRDFAMLDERAKPNPYSLAKLWSDLTESRATIVECFFSETRCFVAVSPVLEPAGADRRLLPHKVRVLERILLGEGQKAIALALRVAPSTVTLMSGECLRAMGLDCRSSRVPMALVMAAYAHANPRAPSARQCRATDVDRDGQLLRIISAPRPDEQLRSLLSPAECAVARLLIEGKRHAEIAELRATSTRTVANQLASGFHKLGVSGRAELLSLLVQGVAPDADAAPLSVLPARLSPRPDSPARSAESLPAA